MATKADWIRVGKQLRRHREQNRRYRYRPVFADEHNINIRLVADLETGRRTNFTAFTLSDLEDAYDLEPGNIAEMLKGGPLRPRKAHRPRKTVRAVSDGQPAETASPDSQPAEADSAPEEDPPMTIPEIRRHIQMLTEMLDAYEAQQEDPPRANGGNLRSA